MSLSQQLQKAESSAWGLWKLNRLLAMGIPFNRPHRFRVMSVEPSRVCVAAPFRRQNYNHLRGMHACAIATVGELAAGLMLIRHFSDHTYRLILSHLSVEYERQARSQIVSKVVLSTEQLEAARTALSAEGVFTIEMTSDILDASDMLVARVQTRWQLKQWALVRRS